MHYLLLCCESSRKYHHAAQTTPTLPKPILTCLTKCIAVQPSMASFVISFFNFEKFGVKPWIPFTQLNQATHLNLEESNFDMFYKKIIAEQSSVIQYA